MATGLISGIYFFLKNHTFLQPASVWHLNIHSLLFPVGLFPPASSCVTKYKLAIKYFIQMEKKKSQIYWHSRQPQLHPLFWGIADFKCVANRAGIKNWYFDILVSCVIHVQFHRSFIFVDWLISVHILNDSFVQTAISIVVTVVLLAVLCALVSWLKGPRQSSVCQSEA